MKEAADRLDIYIQRKMVTLPVTLDEAPSLNVSDLVAQPIENWRRGWGSNPRSRCQDSSFRDCPIRPLSHLSAGQKVSHNHIRTWRSASDTTEAELGCCEPVVKFSCEPLDRRVQWPGDVPVPFPATLSPAWVRPYSQASRRQLLTKPTSQGHLDRLWCHICPKQPVP